MILEKGQIEINNKTIIVDCISNGLVSNTELPIFSENKVIL